MVCDPLHGYSSPEIHWTTTNVGEALPGVMSPLGWTFFGPYTDYALREALYWTGAYSGAERRTPASPDDRLFRIFFGRPAVNVDALCEVGDRMPGTSAEHVAGSIIGDIPAGIVSTPVTGRYPFVALRLPYSMVRWRLSARPSAARIDRWWRTEITKVPRHDAVAALAAFRSAATQFRDCVADQTTLLFSVVQPMYGGLGALIERAGVGDIGTLTGGYGGVPENAVVAALWEAAHRDGDLTEVLSRFGFHGPFEGEISGRVWREDDSPLRRLLADYSAADPAADPARREADRRAERKALEKQVLARMPVVVRPAVQGLLAYAGSVIPMRGVLKIAFLQALDVCRANARHLGRLAADAGALEDPEDIFYLTVDELAHPFAPGLTDTVAARREIREQYSRLTLPVSWRGMPTPVLADESGCAEVEGDGNTIDGIGVSPGTVEGIARVVEDPTFTEVEPGEILVARTTDPSWASVMFVSKALVVDIGGPLSHAAVVAREMGIPCVVNTRLGTRRLRSGDVIRVDGKTGTVEILARARQESATAAAENIHERGLDV